MDWTQISAAIVVLLGAVAAYFNNQTQRNKNAVTAETKLDDIHVLVNSRLTTALDDIAKLREYIDANKKPGDPPVPTLTP